MCRPVHITLEFLKIIDKKLTRMFSAFLYFYEGCSNINKNSISKLLFTPEWAYNLYYFLT